MTACPACKAILTGSQRFCSSCGASADVSPDGLTRSTALPTPRAPGVADPPSAAEASGAMLPGTVISGRYRVIALVGRGGMGEVYRADDLKLGQPVALKFLPRSVEREGASLSRLLDEVRIARQVAHPNVCRVYDVGESEGRHFLSMEFIDGEDLASLLRRIGRVPPEKAVQIARQLCAGLAAAHDQGVLHRDLKPANVMLDGRGHARLTDFGLAGLQERIPQAEVASGTPAYMAPEQLDGRGVSVRSDIYSLGLVLYELFAGRPAFGRAASLNELRQRRSGPVQTPSSPKEALDPATERVILRCLEHDPALRPASALAVSAALPGGDALAAALAAGETPAPDVVAASPTEGALGAGAAAGVLMAALVLWSAAFVLTTWPYRHLSFERSPAGLADRARDLLSCLGHRDKPTDRAWGYTLDGPLLRLLKREPPAGLVDAARRGDAPVVRFWYRESSQYLVPRTGEWVTPVDPPFGAPGDRSVEMTTDGRLLSLRALPPAGAKPATGETDWTPLLAAAELGPGALDPAAPALVPPDFADARAAWRTRTAAAAPALGLRIEAASLGGLPVFFSATPDLPAEASTPHGAATGRERLFYLLLAILFSSVLAAALWLARRNHLAARADRKGALRVAAVVLFAELGAWVLAARHSPVTAEFSQFFEALSSALFAAAVIWVLYMALEPLLRRRSPQSLVSWTRLLAGRPGDPLVGRDLLLGSLCGAAHVVLFALVGVWLWKTGQQPVPAPIQVRNLIGVPVLFRVAADAMMVSFAQSMGFLVLWQLFSWALRSSTRGAFAVGVLILFGLSVGNGIGVITVLQLAEVVLILFALTRLGLLASVVMLWMLHLNVFFPLWSDPSAWFAGESAAVFVMGALPAVWGLWISVNGPAQPSIATAATRP